MIFLTLGNHNNLYQSLDTYCKNFKDEFDTYTTKNSVVLEKIEYNIIKKAVDSAVSESKLSSASLIYDLKFKIDELTNSIIISNNNSEAMKKEVFNILNGYEDFLAILKSVNINDASLMTDRSEKDKLDKKSINIKSIIKFMTGLLKILSDNLEKVTKKQDNMVNVISEAFKNDLKKENISIVQFMMDEIKKVVEKFSSQLNNKAEINLIERLTKEIENKYDSEISKKLDKKEVKKNNNIMNKKVS